MPETILINGRISTLDPRLGEVEAPTIQNSLVHAVGSNADIMRSRTEAQELSPRYCRH